ncbi:MAG: fused MFS/spermidine synthase [Myxococcota bacterium]|nr:fused MFS/spermidine synthase [Myxococcota bacterium]
MKPLSRAWLFVNVFAGGASVILIEILGTRVIGPVFGVSLFVWSALLAVTLGALAIGYYSGGVLVDRSPNQRLLGVVVTASGVLLAVVPLLRVEVLRSAEVLGPRGGSLAAATVLFAPCLIALGMIGPIAVRLLALDLRAAGHGVGLVYAVSTAGSLLGTYVTGFLLLPAFETDHILFAASALLTLMGGASLARHGWRAALAAVAVPLFAANLVPRVPLPSGIAVLDRSQSLYGLVEVIEDTHREVRFLRADHSVLGAQVLRDHSSGFAFTHLLEAVQFLRPAARDMLQIGLGTGALPSVLGGRRIKVDVVEIDPAVALFARRYFGFVPNGEVHQEDARTFLGRAENHYDLIVHDVFTGGTTPEHLLSLEVLRRVHDRLRPGGVLALNFIGYHEGPNAEASRAVARTVRAVFPVVRTFMDEAPDDRPRGAANLIFFASDDALIFVVPEGMTFENDVCEHILRSFQNWEVLDSVPDGPLVTDALNPLARLQLPIAEEHFAAMNELLPVDVWLH